MIPSFGKFFLSTQQSSRIPDGKNLTRNLWSRAFSAFCCARISHRNFTESQMWKFSKNRQSLLSLMISKDDSRFSSIIGFHRIIVTRTSSRLRMKFFLIKNFLRISSSLFSWKFSSSSSFLRLEIRDECFRDSFNDSSASDEWTEITVKGCEVSEGSLKPLKRHKSTISQIELQLQLPLISPVSRRCRSQLAELSFITFPLFGANRWIFLVFCELFHFERVDQLFSSNSKLVMTRRWLALQ